MTAQAAPPGAMPPGGTPGAGPTGSPMATPQPQEGLQRAARVNVQLAVQMLQRLLPAFPLDSDENKAVMKALSALQGGFGKTESQDRELVPAEILQLLSQTNTPSTPGAGAMAAKPNPGAAAPMPT